MILSGTGHRPDKLLGYQAIAHDALALFCREQLADLKPDTVISGMALGFDIALAEAAVEMSIPLMAAIPFKGQESRWPIDSRLRYERLLKSAAIAHVVCEGGYAAYKMQARNEWMSDKSDVILALFNGTSGGTANCVAYAKKCGKKIINCWEDFEKWKKLHCPR